MKSDLASPITTGRRLGALLVGYLALVVAVITLAPFGIDPMRSPRVYWIVLDGGWVSDVLLNIVLFVPIGLALQRTFRWEPWRVATVAVVASAGIEAFQLFIAPRFSTVSDVVANTGGAWVGALLSRTIDRRLGTGRELVGRLFLDLPLMGIVYLLIPLLWLDGLAAAGDPARAWLALLPASAGGVTLAALAHTGRLASPTRTSSVVAVGVAGWFLLGIAPALRTNAVAAGAGFVGTIAIALVFVRVWHRAVRRDRRIEPQVVRVILPVLAVYAGLTGLEPGVLQLGADRGDARLEILRWLEHAGSLALLGYLAAEWRGRRDEREMTALAVPVCLVAGGAIALRLMVAGFTTSIALIAIIAAALGATLYRRQRDHVLALARSDAPGV